MEYERTLDPNAILVTPDKGEPYLLPIEYVSNEVLNNLTPPKE